MPTKWTAIRTLRLAIPIQLLASSAGSITRSTTPFGTRVRLRRVTGPSFLDLFAGAGGLSLGLRSAGWQPLLAIEYWNEAATTYGKNFGGEAVWESDIADVSVSALAARLDCAPDWVVGGPPCQGFSTVGKRARHDPRNRLFLEFHRIVECLKPNGFILENVLGLRDMRFVDEVKSTFAELGYTVTFHVLKAADYGVPQLRRRVVFVGRLGSCRWLGPTPSHSDRDYVSVWDAIGDLPPLKPGETEESYGESVITSYQAAMRIGSMQLQGHTASKHPDHLVKAISFIPDGGNRQSIPVRYQPASGFHNSYSRLNSKLPAVAITSNMSKPSATRCIHPFQNRGLTAREGARLQGFPDAFHFHGGHVSQRLQIANAVPPLLAAAMGTALMDEARWAVAPFPQVPAEEQLVLSVPTP